MNNNIVIDWIRHAESCTNLLDEKVTDNYNSNNNITNFKGFLRKINMEEDEIYKNDSKPFKSDIDSVNKNLETFIEESDKDDCEKPITNEIIQSECIGKESTDDTCWKATVDACKDSKKAKAAYTKYKMKKSSWLYHPTLSFIGIQQAIALGKDKDFKKILKEQKYQVIITSATARTIMTALLSLQNQDPTDINYKTKRLLVVPYINEHENVAGDFGLDRANAGLPHNKIDSIVAVIISWLTQNRHLTGNYLTGNYLTVDTEFYKKKCKEALNNPNDKHNPYKADIDKFNELIPELLEHGMFTKKSNATASNTNHLANVLANSKINILAYAHGYVILNKFKIYRLTPPNSFLPNVSIYRENQQLNPQISNIHKGMKVRSNSNNETTDNNLCSLDSLRGDINQILIMQNTSVFYFNPFNSETIVGGYRKKSQHTKNKIKNKSKHNKNSLKSRKLKSVKKSRKNRKH
jgi:hypothetical protein